jgi:taurine dioxygenase
MANIRPTTNSVISPTCAGAQAEEGDEVIRVEAAAAALGAYVYNYRLDAQQLDRAAAEIKGWLDQYLVVVLRRQTLTPSVHRDLVARFGPLFLHHADDGVLFVDGIPEVLEIRKEPDATRLFGGSDWHADVTFRKPAGYVSVLHAKILPPCGGDTAFASGVAAYAALAPGLRKMLDGLNAVHCYNGPGQPEHPTEIAEHPVVRVHPQTGARGLYLNRMFVKRFARMTEEESAPLIAFIDQHVSKPEFTFRHRWQDGDLVFWDNRFSLHYPINDFTGSLRLLHRCTALETD